MSIKNFRIGQRVQSAEDVSRVFVIRKSRKPERIYFGANRWWTKNELQPLGAGENPLTSQRLNGKAECAQNAPKCAQGISGEPESASRLPKQSCLVCKVIFQPMRPWQRFDCEDCRRAYWKQRRAGGVKQEQATQLATVVIQ
jgi:hypothetical protein